MTFARRRSMTSEDSKVLDWLAHYFTYHTDGGQRLARLERGVLRFPERDRSCLDDLPDGVDPSSRFYSLFGLYPPQVSRIPLDRMYGLVTSRGCGTYFRSQFSDLSQRRLVETGRISPEVPYSPPGDFALDYVQDMERRRIPVSIVYSPPVRNWLRYLFQRLSR